MRDVIYSFGVSLDGFITDPDGGLDWSVPSEELHRFHNEQAEELGGHLCGRRLYETMVYWETAPEEEELADYELEFAQIWQRLPKVVFSTTLEKVEGNTRLVRGNVVEEVTRLKQEAGKPLGVGGATLAAQLIEHGLVDEYRLFVHPVALGGGTPYFPPLREPIGVALAETRVFPGGVTYLRYRRG